MAPPLRPEQPCSSCGSPRFGVVDNIHLRSTCDDRKGWSNVIQPRFTAVICAGCGQTRLFMADDEEHLLKTCAHEVVDVTGPTPYR